MVAVRQILRNMPIRGVPPYGAGGAVAVGTGDVATGAGSVGAGTVAVGAVPPGAAPEVAPGDAVWLAPGEVPVVAGAAPVEAPGVALGSLLMTSMICTLNASKRPSISESGTSCRFCEGTIVPSLMRKCWFGGNT